MFRFRSFAPGAAALGLLLAIPFTASALVIDDFGDDSFAAIALGGLPNPKQATLGVAAGGAIGGSRAAVLERTAGGGSASVDTNLSASDSLSVSTGAGVVANAKLIYDGNTDTVVDASGLDVDVTDGGTNSLLRLLVEADQSDIVIRVTFRQGSNASFVDLKTAGGNTFGSPQLLTANFAGLTAGGSGLADLAHVGAITVDIFGPTSFDVSIRQFEAAVPEPGSLALLGLGLAGLRYAGSRARRA